MAYKYSRGAFVASGSVTLEEGLTVTGSSTLGALSGTQIQATALTASALDGTVITGLGINYLPIYNAGTKTFTSSYVYNNIAGGSEVIRVSASTGITVPFEVSKGNITATGSVFSTAFISASSGLQGGGTSTFNTVNINGNLTVAGTTTTVNSTTLEITDKNIVIASGSVTSFDAKDAGITVGGTGYQIKFVSGSAGMPSDSWQFSGSGGYTDLRAGIITATSFNGPVAVTLTERFDTNTTLANGVNYMTGTLTTPRTWTLPSSPLLGDSVRVKAPSNCGTGGGQYILTVSASGAHLIDGEGTAPLESPYAAIECVYVANNRWSIF